MIYNVILKKRIRKKLTKCPKSVRELFGLLLEDLESAGPVQPKWRGFSKLIGNKYHCHLNYNYVACWKHEKKTIVIEVYYVGSRENAPY